eukprot:2503253-Alexandrium_andersonii.AAC.1
MSASLVGSEMCIRDSSSARAASASPGARAAPVVASRYGDPSWPLALDKEHPNSRRRHLRRPQQHHRLQLRFPR